ncbi:MAG: nucleoside 2-deoxyribosyltransferase, partial [Chloroflexi bacterium]|nr:nucleoside 2-deoxyribosyltransferase [Chloroflexota bacterium]
MHVFIAGVMQGSRLDNQIDEQDYRVRISEALQTHLPDVRISDPWVLHPNSVAYEMDLIEQTFLANTDLVNEADVVIAYLPWASMGTAIEMWTAYRANKPVIVVTPLVHNWVVRLTADEVLPDLDSLLEYIQSGRLAHFL